ncbi:hypothetical protein [Halohasta salina]|uniref:hypothetical protein n=1 Tax=Halohasta salina TaxID=2961621 RepID=UPI0020A5EC7F|nr:hypothetical protein [Halohasta salina]
MRHLRDRLAMLFGVVAVSVVVPPLGYAIGGPFDGSITVVDTALAVSVFALGTVGAKRGLRRVDDPARRFRKGIEFAGLLAVAGIVPLVGFVATPTEGFVAALPFGVGFVLGLAAAFLVGYVADRAIVDRSRAETDSRLTWHAKRRPERGRVRLLQAATAVVAAGFVIRNALDGRPGMALLWVAIGGLQFVQDLSRLRRRQYEIIDAGLVTTFGHLPWDDFDGYQLTDDDLILYGNVWPFGTVAYDRESVDDLEAVVDALDRQLPRLEGDHDEPSPVDNFRQELFS